MYATTSRPELSRVSSRDSRQCGSRRPSPLAQGLAALAALVFLATAAGAAPIIHESGWTHTRSVFIPQAQAAHFNPVDGLIYAMRSTVVDGGLYRIEADGSTTHVSPGVTRGLAVHPASGDIFTSHGGNVYRTAFGATGRSLWASGFAPGGDNLLGIGFPAPTYSGGLLEPGEALVVNQGSFGPAPAVWRFSALTSEGEEQIPVDAGLLGQPFDVTIGSSKIYITGITNTVLPGRLLELLDDGTLIPVPTDVTIATPIGVVIDPLTDELLILDRATRRVLRLDPVSGATTMLVNGFGQPGTAGIDISPDGSQLVVSSWGHGRVHIFTRETLTISTPAEHTVPFGTSFEVALEAALGTPPYQWSLADGVLPAGVDLSGDSIQGIPEESGDFDVTVRVTDADGFEAEKQLHLRVLLASDGPPLVVRKIGTQAVLGRDIFYFIVVDNLGDEVVPEYSVFELLDPFYNLQEATPPVDDRSELMLIWNLTDIGPGERQMIRYVVRADNDTPFRQRVLGGPACANLDLAFIYGAMETLEECEEKCEDLPIFGNFCEANCKVQITTTVTRADGFLQAAECSTFEDYFLRPRDPNEKLALQRRFIRPDEALTYFIHYENVGETEARDVFLDDVLSSDLDLSTLTVFAPDGTAHPIADGDTAVLHDEPFVREIEGEINGEPFVIEIPARETHSASLNGSDLDWDLVDVDLAPGATDFVMFSVKPQPGLPDGTVISNSADIRFEIFETITTPAIENVIDGVAPTSAVDPLPADSPPTFEVTWSGSDIVGEIIGFSLFVSVDGGPFTPVLDDTAATRFTFEGEVGREYAFATVAVDSAGNRELKVPAAEAVTTVTLPVDDDPDGDGVPSTDDGCPNDFDPDQLDLDADLIGDACDAQVCGNGVVEGDVAGIDFQAPGFYQSEECDDGNDVDGDGCSACLLDDSDEDGTDDVVDNCPGEANASQVDGDGDGVGDACDVCPADADPAQQDLDLDGLGDVCDADDDGDGVADSDDNCVRAPNSDQLDGDLDGLGDRCDLFPNDSDVDSDGLDDGADNCPFDANADQADEDGNGIGDVCEPLTAWLIQDADSQLFELGVAGAAPASELVCAALGIELNSAGYRAADGMLYAVELTAFGNNGIVRIDPAGCTVEPLGPAGLPTNQRFDAGDVSTDGTTMFINRAGLNPLYTVDLTAPSPIAVPVSMTGAKGFVHDWAYRAADGLLYGGDSLDGQLAALDPVTGARSDAALVDTGLGLLPAGAGYGGAWFDDDGLLVLYRNDGEIYFVDVEVPVVVRIETGRASSRNEAAGRP